MHGVQVQWHCRRWSPESIRPQSVLLYFVRQRTADPDEPEHMPERFLVWTENCEDILFYDVPFFAGEDNLEL